jgi:hypothetical protein
MDWKTSSGGQGHKSWCDLGCGEEDVDWEVVTIDGKGLGIRAKRFIPKMTRIMVDQPRNIQHPTVQALMPENGTLFEKFDLNALSGGVNGSSNSVCARISRANHSCDQNASYDFDETLGVFILSSEKDIQKGEEICISYAQCDDPGNSTTPDMARDRLVGKWGIVCTLGCRCYDRNLALLWPKMKLLDAKIMSSGSQGDVSSALVRW